ncbi:Aste57867_4786 [Aphanomyces stellatus]|uniref:Aste57867_4786 protein n=2 Tax=Aphanomyces stellatus TaxID=120398 RepID=A0A485KDG1_9STRA|nr:hypothetical protein As57867_004773 [Aphanomyces stellatus]VFT81881.1 Aste57867_4786 [Aphanomyces stellatus]
MYSWTVPDHISLGGEFKPACSASPDISADLEPEMILGDYRLLPSEPSLFDSIFHGVHIQRSGDAVCIKLTSSLREIEFLKEFRTAEPMKRAIVASRALVILKHETCYAIVMERDMKDLRSKFAATEANEAKLTKFGCVQDMILALQFHHDHGVVHGNICLQNAVLQSERIKLFDFTHATKRNLPLLAHAKATIEYCPPEMAQFIVHGGESPPAKTSYDVWCLGVLILKLFSPGQKISQFENKDEASIVHSIASDSFSLDKSIQDTVLSTPQKVILERCFERDPSHRCTLKDVWEMLPTKNTMDDNFKTLREGQVEIKDGQIALQRSMAQLDKFVVPTMWTVERDDKKDFTDAMQKLIGRIKLRVVFLCEMRGDGQDCDMTTDWLEERDGKLKATLESDYLKVFLKDAMPILKAIAIVFKIVGFLSRFSDELKTWFDYDQMENATRAVAALEHIVGAVDLDNKLALEEQLEQVVKDMNTNPNENHKSEEDKLKQALKEYRTDDKIYERLKDLLKSIGVEANGNKKVIGGLTQKLIRSNYEDKALAGQVRWVCAHHKKAFKDAFVDMN